MKLVSLCIFCGRYWQDKQRYRAEQRDHPFFEYCEAYPDADGIPIEVIVGRHFEPREGDHGLQFIPSDRLQRDGLTLDDVKRWYDFEDEPYEPIPDYSAIDALLGIDGIESGIIR